MKTVLLLAEKSFNNTGGQIINLGELLVIGLAIYGIITLIKRRN